MENSKQTLYEGKTVGFTLLYIGEAMIISLIDHSIVMWVQMVFFFTKHVIRYNHICVNRYNELTLAQQEAHGTTIFHCFEITYFSSLRLNMKLCIDK